MQAASLLSPAWHARPTMALFEHAGASAACTLSPNAPEGESQLQALCGRTRSLAQEQTPIFKLVLSPVGAVDGDAGMNAVAADFGGAECFGEIAASSTPFHSSLCYGIAGAVLDILAQAGGCVGSTAKRRLLVMEQYADALRPKPVQHIEERVFMRSWRIRL